LTVLGSDGFYDPFNKDKNQKIMEKAMEKLYSESKNLSFKSEEGLVSRIVDFFECNRLGKNEKQFKKVEKLIKAAKDCGSTDNTTVMVVKIKV